MSFLSKVTARYLIMSVPDRHNSSGAWSKEETKNSNFDPKIHKSISTEKVQNEHGNLYLHKFHDTGRNWDYYLLSESTNPQDHSAVITHVAGAQDLTSGKFIVDQAITRPQWKKMGYGAFLHSLVADRHGGLLSGDSLSVGEEKLFQKLARNPKYKVKFGEKGTTEPHILDLVTDFKKS